MKSDDKTLSSEVTQDTITLQPTSLNKTENSTQDNKSETVDSKNKNVEENDPLNENTTKPDEPESESCPCFCCKVTGCVCFRQFLIECCALCLQASCAH